MIMDFTYHGFHRSWFTNPRTAVAAIILVVAVAATGCSRESARPSSLPSVATSSFDSTLASSKVFVYLPCCGLPGSRQDLEANYAMDYRPSTTIFDASGAHLLTNATWQVWNSTEAIGTGTAEVQTCNPVCAGSGYDKAPVTVTLSDPMKCGAVSFWSTAIWHFPESIPPGEKQNDPYKFSC